MVRNTFGPFALRQSHARLAMECINCASIYVTPLILRPFLHPEAIP